MNTDTESRREFEEWLVDYYHESSTMKYDNGDYINVEAVVAWEAWQAAREQQKSYEYALEQIRISGSASHCREIATEALQSLTTNPQTSEKI
jgi:hypothetical protein